MSSRVASASGATWLKSPESTRPCKHACARLGLGDRPWDHYKDKEGSPLNRTIPGIFRVVLLTKIGPGILSNILISILIQNKKN